MKKHLLCIFISEAQMINGYEFHKCTRLEKFFFVLSISFATTFRSCIEKVALMSEHDENFVLQRMLHHTDENLDALFITICITLVCISITLIF
jgi:hypothetical protein